MMLYRQPPEEEPERWHKVVCSDKELYIVLGAAVGCILLALVLG